MTTKRAAAAAARKERQEERERKKCALRAQKRQIHFLRSLSSETTNTIVRYIREGKIPQEWDGHELRCLLADGCAMNASMSVIRKEPRGRRARDYRNTIIVNNL